MTTTRTGCAFAPRCASAQARCLVDDPVLSGPPEHQYRCHFPLGTDAGEHARAQNLGAGVTVTGLTLVGR